MRKLRAIWRRLFHAAPAKADFDVELESHIEMHVEDGMRAGLGSDEARRQALIRLGGAEQTRQAYRERSGLPWVESLLRDLRYGIRTLAKHPAVTAIAILSIALGIGANATIFSMVSRFLLRPAPVGDPTHLLALHIAEEGGPCCNPFPYPLYSDLRDDAKSFSDITAYYAPIPASISGMGDPQRVWGQLVTPNFFDVIELPMTLGHGFQSSDDRVPEVVLGARLWRRRFNADPSIVGRQIELSGRSFTVVGVAPPSFHSVEQVLDAEFWAPLGNASLLAPTLPGKTSREFHWLELVARLKPGATRAQAAAELDTLARRFAHAYPATDKGNRFVFEQAGSLPPRERGSVIIFLTALSVVVLLVLAVAGVNVANLLFAQAVVRQRDMALRLAVGATPSRLRRQMLTESVLLGVCGGAVGVVLSAWAVRGLSEFRLPAPVPLSINVDLDWRTLLYAFLLSFLGGWLLGLAPAWAASCPRLANALKGEDALANPGRRLTLRNVLVVVQIAMAVVLVCVTTLFLRSLQTASAIDLGFRPKGLLSLSFDPSLQGFDAHRTISLLKQIQQRAATVPGVNSVAITDISPLSGGHRSEGFARLGTALSGSSPTADLYMVGRGYFKVLGIPFVAGRDFSSEAETGPKTAVVNQAFVKSVFAGESPVGQRVRDDAETFEIIGVVGNVKSRTIGENSRPVLYRSLPQSIAGDPSIFGYALLVRTLDNPAGVAAEIVRQIHLLDSAMAVYNVETMEEHVRTAYFLPRLAATLFGIFGSIGLVLAIIGLYGVMSYSVSRRTREIGIRMALGAKTAAVERMVLRQGLVLSLIAVALGWPGAWMVAKLATSFLYGIQPHDALTFAAVPPFLVLIALAACWIPARRAASVDLMHALRRE